MLAHAWDRNLGGRDFDEVLFDHFCEEFGAKHKIDIKSNARASFRLRLACEKVTESWMHVCCSSFPVQSLVTARFFSNCMLPVSADEEGVQCKPRSHNQRGMHHG